MRTRLRFAVEVALLALVLVGVNGLGARHFWRGDFTRHKIYALSDRSRALVGSLGGDVAITALVLRGAPGSGELRGDLDELFERLRAASPHVSARFVDADQEPQEKRIVAARFRLTDEQIADGVVVVAHDTQWKVLDRGALADFDWPPAHADDGQNEDGQGPRLRAWRGEAAVVGAMLAVTSKRAPQICFSVGHGEPSFGDASDGNDSDGNDSEWSGFADALRRDQLTPRPVADTAFSDCAVLVIGSPESSWSAVEASAVRNYLHQGGHLLALIGPSFDASQGRFVDTGLEALLAGYGVALGKNFVVDRPRIGDSDLRFAVERGCGAHAIVQALGGRRLLFDAARSVRATAARAVELCASSAASWGEHDLLSLAAHAASFGPQDERGPLPLGVAVTDETGTPRVVVWGSSEIAASAALPANEPLLIASIEWLLGRSPELGIAARPVDELRLTLDDAQRTRAFELLVLVVPFVVLLLGVLMYWLRRK